MSIIEDIEAMARHFEQFVGGRPNVIVMSPTTAAIFEMDPRKPYTKRRFRRARGRVLERAKAEDRSYPAMQYPLATGTDFA